MLNIEWLESNNPVNFDEALNFMENRALKIIEGSAAPLIWLTEHNAVYTAGISAKDEDMLQKTDIPIYKTNRGGKYTYHGHGMKIIYVMLDLKKFFAPRAPDIAQFVEFLENWVIDFLQEFGVTSLKEMGINTKQNFNEILKQSFAKRLAIFEQV